MTIRKADIRDEPAIWEIFSQVISSGDTYVFDSETSIDDFRKLWMADYMMTYVAEDEGKILGTYVIKANQMDRGSHVANGAYMVHPNAFGKGIGRLMCQHSLDEARRAGFYAMQFNLVVSTNTPAVHLWKKMGFEIIGTIPDGFSHKTLGLVDAFIMYQKL